MDNHVATPLVDVECGNAGLMPGPDVTACCSGDRADPAAGVTVTSASSRKRRLGAPRHAVGLIAAGLAATVMASLGLMSRELPSGPGRAAVPSPAPTGAAAPVPAFSAGGPSDVTVEQMTYQPWQASSWHVHNGLHAVEVLSGTLTIYDADCRAHTYGPGESYVGGAAEHRARNASDEPLEMVVTDILPPGTSMAEFVVALPPPPCAFSASATPA